MKKFGLIGFPLGHSFSVKYFAKKFEKEQIENCSYSNYPLEEINAFEVLRNEANLYGLNVTIPYKEAVIPYLDELDSDAEKIGAVNTILFKNGKTKGYNTDIYGFENALKPLLQSHHKKALILGTGGASKAVKFVFDKLNIDHLFVSRNPKKADITQISYQDISKNVLDNYAIIVNTTPLGTYPQTKFCPEIPYPFLNEKHLLFDLVYNPKKTVFMQKGKQQNAIVTNGYEMLVLQAEKSWEIWNNEANY